MEGIYNTPLIGASELNNVSKVSLKNIKDFIVEEKGKEEVITILVIKGRNLKLMNNNNNWTNDAMKIKELYF